MSAYVYVCRACEHPLHRHGLIDNEGPFDGPYRCAECGCEVKRDAPCYEFSKREYEAFLAEKSRA